MIKTVQAVLIAVTALILVYMFAPSRGVTGRVRDPGSRSGLPAFTLKDADGKSWSLDQQRGKVVLVNVWATWCPPCRKETPGLVRIAHDYADRVAMVGITSDDPPDAVRKFAAEYKVPYPLLIPEKDFELTNSIDNLPTTFLLDRQGRIAKTYVGAVSEEVFRADLDKVLAEGV